MLLKQKDPWFVAKNNSELLSSFDKKTEKIVNENAFVEIIEDDYQDIKSFLTKLHDLSNNDFIIESEKKNDEK